MKYENGFATEAIHNRRNVFNLTTELTSTFLNLMGVIFAGEYGGTGSYLEGLGIEYNTIFSDGGTGSTICLPDSYFIAQAMEYSEELVET